MSSILSIINWTPARITPTLNGVVLSPIDPSNAKDNYYPWDVSVERVSGSPSGGVWGAVNNITFTSSDSSQTQIYDNLKDPSGARPNIALLMWILPGSAVFSQIGERLEIVTPNG
jgi:hypothetical protein